MTQGELFRLFEKYIHGQASVKEADLLLRLLGTEEASSLLQAYIKAYRASDLSFQENDMLLERVYQQIQKKNSAAALPANIAQVNLPTTSPATPVKLTRSHKWLWKIAGLFLILILSAALVIFILPKYTTSHRTVMKQQIDFQHSSPQDFRKLIKTGAYTENLQLEDHSSVIIRAGSRLGITKDFNTTRRSVFLDGEAFFEVAHNAAKPFLIHTGPLTVEVLGTAFNIKSFSKQDSASVFVTSGKVMVWDSAHKLNRVLTANESISYQKDLQTYIVRTQNTDPQTALAWAAKDMDFDKVSMQHVLSTLSRRYKVQLDVRDSMLLKTKVKIAFTGTESLTTVMDALSIITATDYVIQQDTLRIFSKK